MYVFLRFFYVFFKIQKKHDFLRFFELLHAFSRTVTCGRSAVELQSNITFIFTRGAAARSRTRVSAKAKVLRRTSNHIQNINRKSYVIYRMVSFMQTTLSEA